MTEFDPNWEDYIADDMPEVPEYDGTITPKDREALRNDLRFRRAVGGGNIIGRKAMTDQELSEIKPPKLLPRRKA